MEEQIREVFPCNLNRIMEQKHITPKQICDALGVTKQTVSEWKHGKKIPRMDKIDKLVVLLGVSRSDLLEKKKPPEGGKSELIELIIRELASLPTDKQQDVLRYIRFLKNG